jgi:hypothetical protein
MRLFTGILVMLLSCPAFSLTPSTALSMVPRGRLIEQSGRDFLIKTPAGTKIGVEFLRNGKFQEAKGHNLNRGDELEPGDGLISLSSAAHALSVKGITPQGHWILELDEEHGWVYEFENTLVNAKTGQIINESSLPVYQTAAKSGSHP